MQQWWSLSNPGMQEALIEVPTMQCFAGIDLINVRIPDKTTILSFRHLLEQNDLGEKICSNRTSSSRGGKGISKSEAWP